jgi:uncharacterized protein YidB (DUF937 family)
MKMSIIFTALILVSQSGLAAVGKGKSGIGELDAVRTKVNDVIGRLELTESEVGTPALRTKMNRVKSELDGVVRTEGLSQKVADAMLDIPHLLTLVLSKSNFETEQSAKLEAFLQMLGQKGLGTIEPGTARVLNNLFEKGSGLGEKLTSMLSKIEAKMRVGKDVESAFKEVVQEMANAKKMTYEKFLEELSKCKL